MKTTHTGAVLARAISLQHVPPARFHLPDSLLPVRHGFKERLVRLVSRFLKNGWAVEVPTSV
ncbi:MAG: hypothetical protein PHV28_00930 [Kiritimatiellae bacterium]|nr:hypothetical protein [Kiritimatiellia bacterium]